jgi:hypothetical protein
MKIFLTGLTGILLLAQATGQSIDATLAKYIYTDSTYTPFSEGKITILNSFPKGGSLDSDGSQYQDAQGRQYAFANFWTQVQNHTPKIMELHIDFRQTTFPIFKTPGSFLQLLIPDDLVNLDQLDFFNYGLKDIQNKFDQNNHQPARQQYRLNPGESVTFFVSTLSYNAAGTPRAQMMLKGNNLFYEVNFAPHGGGLIPCGTIKFHLR